MFFRRSFLPWVNLRLLVYVLNDRETRGIFRKYKAGLLWAVPHNSQRTLHGLPELGSASFSTILSVALALSDVVLGSEGAWRVHGGGFAGTIQAFVPYCLLDKYVDTLEHTFGKGKCHKLFIRPQGAIKVEF